MILKHSEIIINNIFIRKPENIQIGSTYKIQIRIERGYALNLAMEK